MSRLSYLINIWGGSTPNLIRRAQTIQNMAARWVTSSRKRTRVSTLLGISKIVEKTLLHQILQFLERYNLVPHSHHGAIANKSTQTLIIELHDSLLRDLNDDTDSALLVLDQSKAYDLVNHGILMEKFKILGFNRKSLAVIESYLSDRKQFVEIQGIRSDNLTVGPQSVTQGSTLSGALYLIAILDLPLIFQAEQMSPLQMSDSKDQNVKTFVDDNFIIVRKNQNSDLKESITQSMERVKHFMDANKLKLNSSKTKIMLISNKTDAKTNFQIQIEDKTIRHSPKLKLLGNILTDNMSWNSHVSQIVLPALANTLRTIKMTTKYLDTKFRKMYMNSLYRSRLLFAIETWGGADKSLISKIQRLQDQAGKISCGNLHPRDSNRMRQTRLGWLPIQKEIELATHVYTWKVINMKVPEELSARMPVNTSGRRIQEQRKLFKRPKDLDKN